MGLCIHFRGIQHDLCGAGINIRQLVGGDDFGWGIRIPCLVRDAKTCSVTCESRILPTREQAEATVDECDKLLKRTMLAVTLAHEHAKTNGLGVGHGGMSSLPCLLECGGSLKYSVAGINGHMHARCTTKGCVSWME